MLSPFSTSRHTLFLLPALLAVILGIGGCSRAGFWMSADGATTRIDSKLSRADLLIDAADLAPLDLSVADSAPTGCLPWPDPPTFRTPQRLAFSSSSNDQEPFLSHDGLRLYFASHRPGGQGKSDLYYVERPSVNADFGSPQPLTALNTSNNEWRLIITVDGLTAYLSCDWPGGVGKADLWTATRSAPSTPFQRNDFKPLNELNTLQDEHDPFPSRDNQRLYYYTSRWHGSNSGADLLVAQRGASGRFEEPVALPTVNDFPFDDGNPVLSADELLLVFSSTRGGSNDLWYATRTALGEPFVVRDKLPSPVNTPQEENNLHLTADGCGLYFGRQDNLYYTELLKP